jgi:hypothetical protein
MMNSPSGTSTWTIPSIGAVLVGFSVTAGTGLGGSWVGVDSSTAIAGTLVAMREGSELGVTPVVSLTVIAVVFIWQAIMLVTSANIPKLPVRRRFIGFSSYGPIS